VLLWICSPKPCFCEYFYHNLEMAYTVLARKYRSQSFDDIVGQDPIAQTLKNAIKTDRVAHAYLFTGTRGVGKTTMARILAKALNCLASDKPTIQPCCKCASCVSINLGEDIDVIEIDGASNNKVEEIRELRDNAIYRPVRSRYKIYIIDEVHMLTNSAFNALLKTLEEPPSHIKFILATTEPNKVIPTIQSRCQRFDFRNISPAVITEQLKLILGKEGIKYEDDFVLALAKMANGSMRDGLSLLDRLISSGVEPLTVGLLEEFLGRPDSEKIWTLIERIGDCDAAGVLEVIEQLIVGGNSEVQILDSTIDSMRDLLVVKSAGVKSGLVIMTEQQRKRAAALSEKFDSAGLIYNIAALEKLRWAVKNSDTSRALLEASMLRLALSEHFLDIDKLLLQARGGTSAPADSAAVKKKVTVLQPQVREDKPAVHQQPQQVIQSKPDTKELNIKYIKEQWQNLLDIITTELGPSTGRLLSCAEPNEFAQGLLTLSLSTQIHKDMCLRNGRTEQVQDLLSRHFSTAIKLKFEVAVKEQNQQASAENSQKGDGQKRNKLLNDPAVKTVILGLDATITGIEEKNTKNC
jgi:DNA polymerase III subunit gamma/tau